MNTVFSYIFMAFAAFCGITILNMQRDYKQWPFLWAIDILITFSLWYSFGFAIPYVLFAVTFATMVVNPFKPMEGTAAAKREEKRKIEGEKYLKEHPKSSMCEYDRQAMTIARWIK